MGNRLKYDVQQGAAVCIQSAWRGFNERRRLVLWREAAVIIQTNWRLCRQRCAALRIQTAWRRHRARELYLKQRDFTIHLQAVSRGYLARQRFRELREQRLKSTQLLNGNASRLTVEEMRRDMGLDLSLWEDSCKDREKSKQPFIGAVEASEGNASREETVLEISTSEVTIRERPRTLEDPNQRTRAKRESRRMRELEQAKFSLELLKVRSTGATSPSDERRWSMEMVSEVPHTPQGTPDSQSSKGSFELLNIDDCFKDKAPFAEVEDLGSPSSMPDQHDTFPDVPKPTLASDISALAGRHEPPRLPTFYVPSSESSSLIVKSSTESSAPKPDGTGKPVKEKTESTRRPMVVVISMQKDALLNEEDQEVRDGATQTGESTGPAQPSRNSLYVLEKLEKLNEVKEEREKHQQQQNEKEMMEQIRQQKHILEEQRRNISRNEREMFEKQRSEALQRIEQSRQESSGGRTDKPGVSDRGPAPLAQPEPDFSSQPQVPENEVVYQLKDSRKVPEGWAPKLTLESRGHEARRKMNKKPSTQNIGINMTEKPGNIFFSPKAKVSHAKLDKDISQGKTSGVQNEISLLGHKSTKGREVSRPGHKKARMARTRSDFLTRSTNPQGEGESDEEEYEESPLSPDILLPKQDSEESALEAYHSDSEMVIQQSELRPNGDTFLYS